MARCEQPASGADAARDIGAGAIDSVGSHTLANVCAQTKYRGTVAACGLAGGADFPATVMPFILRGVTLYGINCVYVPNTQRAEAWALLARHLSPARLAGLVQEIGLSEAIAASADLLDGRLTANRVVVDVNR